MSNILEEAQAYVAEKLNGDSQLSGLCTFLVENRKDIDYEIKNALGREGIVGVVMTPKATYAGKYEDLFLAWTLESLEIDIVENPTVNRGKKNGFITGQDAAMRLFDVLCPLAGENEGQFNPVSYEEGEDNGLLVNKCLLKALVYGEHGDVPQPEKPLTYQFVKLLDQAPPLSVQPHEGWMWYDNGFKVCKDEVVYELGDATQSFVSSYVDSQVSSKADISSVHGDYIQDASGYRIDASLSCRTKDLTLPWSLTGSSHSYSLQYDSNSRKWTYVETDAQKIELSYETINDLDIVLWVLDFYAWDSASSEWRFSSGYTTTAEDDVTELYFNGEMWHASRSTIGDDMLATQKWVLAQLSALQARIAQLENNL